MRDLVRLWLFLPLLAACPGVHAQIFMCKDATGRTFTSDRPIPECAGRALREYDRAGIARRDILPPPTPEQKRELELQQEKRRLEELAAEEQRRNDRAMRFRYRNEGEIELARKRAVDELQEQIRRETAVLAAAEKRWHAAKAEADGYRKKNQPIPDELQRNLNDAERAVRESKKTLADHDVEIAATNAKHNETVKKFRMVAGVAAK